MNSYEMGSKYLFAVLDCMVDRDMTLADAKQEISEKHPDWAQAYSTCKNSLLASDNISGTTSTSTGLTYDQLVTGEQQKRPGCSKQEAARSVMATEQGKRAFLERVGGK